MLGNIPRHIAEVSKFFCKKKWRVPYIEKLDGIVTRFSVTEKFIFYTLAIIFSLSSLGLLSKVNNAFLVEVPTEGGSIVEGVVGIPRFINPLLAISEADKYLTALVYSGLMKATPDGELIPDLAESYTVSPDGLTYTFTLKNDIYFHDNTPITADDIVFTVKEAQNPSLKSPKRGNWEGIAIEKVSDKEVRFMLKQPYSPFLENTTLGILPKHLWNFVDVDQFTWSSYNNVPVGSGPYKVKSVKHNRSGLPVSYELEPYDEYALGKPYISKIIFKFFLDENSLVKAYDAGLISAMGSVSPQSAATLIKQKNRVETAPLPRIFGIFLNQNQAKVLANTKVRTALDVALDKDALIKEALAGYGVAIQSPVPIGFLDSPQSTRDTNTNSNSTSTNATGVARAREILEKDGFVAATTTGIMSKKTKAGTETLEFSIATANVPELVKIAELVATTWKEIGAKVEVKPFESSDLSQNVIRARKYDSILFGEDVGRDLDFFPFWHSSQRNDPGLNIAMYANTTADKQIQAGRSATTTEARNLAYKKFEETVITDVPAIFLYSPEFIYVVPKNLKNLDMNTIVSPSERFLNVSNWYIETDKVWKIFLK